MNKASYNVVKQCERCTAPFAIAVRANNTKEARGRAVLRPVKLCPACQDELEKANGQHTAG